MGRGTTKKSFVQELNPWSGITPGANFIRLLLRPIPLVLYPAIAFSILSLSSTVAWVICGINTYASIFQAPPYLMSPGISSLINVSGAIGSVLGAFIGGGFTDLLAEWQARRNGGIFEPEARLVALIVPFFVVPAGLLMYL